MTGSLPEGDSCGFSALRACIFVDKTNQVLEFKRFAHVVVGAALPRFLGDVTVAGEDDVGNAAGLILQEHGNTGPFKIPCQRIVLLEAEHLRGNAPAKQFAAIGNPGNVAKFGFSAPTASSLSSSTYT